jgi:kynurenine formamidase
MKRPGTRNARIDSASHAPSTQSGINQDDRRENTMRSVTLTLLVAITIGTPIMMSTTTAAPALQTGRPNHTVTEADVERWKKDLSNWGRWGKEDQIGTMNLITPAKRKQAAALVKEGVSVSLAHDALTDAAVDNPRPYEHIMQGLGSDRIGVSFHGFAHTHLDSMAHIIDHGQVYNGYTPDKNVVMKDNQGHPRNSIHNLKNGVFTRGILIDIPRLKGVPYLEPSTPIYVEDLEAWEKKAGVKVSAGDALFVRTGRWARRAAKGPWDISKDEAGLHASVVPWLKQRDVALLAGDAPQSVMPSELGRTVHDFGIIYLGLHMLDNADFDPLAEACAARNRWEFLVVIAPLPIVGGTGSPVNPIATF